MICFYTLFSLLQLSITSSNLTLLRTTHALILKLSQDQQTPLANALIGAYVKLSLPLYAYKLLKTLLFPNVVSYTTVISSFAKSNCEKQAVKLFFAMREAGIHPNEYSLVSLLTACIRTLDFHLGFQIHALAVKLGYLDNVFVVNALMGLYGKGEECLDDVVTLFDEMGCRDIVSWNTLISVVVNEGMYEKAFDLFRDMHVRDRFRVDYFTISALLTSCVRSRDGYAHGREIHAHSIRIGLDRNLSVNNALIGFYTKYGTLEDVETLFKRMSVKDVITWTKIITAYFEFGFVDMAVETFQKMPERNSVTFNSMLAGFCQNGEPRKALFLFVQMVKMGLELSDFTLTSILHACGMLMEVKLSEQIHGFILKVGHKSNAFVETALLDMCTRCGRMLDAEKMISRCPPDHGSSVIYTSMICGYARNGQPDEAMSVFHRSQSEGAVLSDEFTLASVFGVCGTLGYHEMGRQIHSHAIKSGIVSDLDVGNSIVSMYFKCANIIDALLAFGVMPSHDKISWNCLIAGHLLHREGDKALAVWSRMELEGVKPDELTISSVISAYRYTSSNLVDDCRKFFLSFRENYGIEPTLEHYVSFVGVLGFWGLLEEAEVIIVEMPFESKASAWRNLLDGCRIHENTIIGKRVAKEILKITPQDPSTYILLSNLYSASGRWHCSEVIRDDMRVKGFQKLPARSWIIHDNKIHSFYGRDKSHSQSKDISSGLEILVLECLKAGYLPDTSFVLHEVEESQKRDFLFNHSAKLAVTYGLLMTRHGKPVRVVKNILLCGDCHSFLKYVSIVARREIIVRDTSGCNFAKEIFTVTCCLLIYPNMYKSFLLSGLKVQSTSWILRPQLAVAPGISQLIVRVYCL
ncbi:hypothetical protein ACFE04_020405 [Oxalis oulophora]